MKWTAMRDPHVQFHNIPVDRVERTLFGFASLKKHSTPTNGSENMTNDETMNYHKRLDELTESESKEWFKATEGKHAIKFLSEGTPYTYEYEGEMLKKVRFDIETKGKEYSFSVTEGQTRQSLYGQLLLIATKSAPANTLKNKTVTLLVTGTGKNTRYTVLEAIGLSKDENDVEEIEVK